MQPCTYYYSFVRFSTDEEKFNKMALYIYSLLKGKEKKTYFHHHHHCCYCYYFLIQDLCFLFFFWVLLVALKMSLQNLLN